MLNMPMSSLTGPYLRSDRSSMELRAYFRNEWGNEPGWIPTLRPSRPSAWRRMTAWLRTRRFTAERPQRTPIAAVAFSGTETALSRRSAPCDHATMEDLGADVDTRFLLCSGCGEVLVVHNGRSWRIHSNPEPAASDSLGEDDRACSPGEHLIDA